MPNTSWLPRVLRWIFRFMTVVLGIAAIAIVVVMIVDPKLPGDAAFGPIDVEIMGQPGVVLLKDSTLMAHYIRNGAVNVRVNDAGGLLEVLKHAGLPLALLTVFFFGFLFELLYRLFRNVGRGQSFTRQSLRLVQIIGISLLAYSVASAFAESWFHTVLFDYISHHAAVVVSGASIHLPAATGQVRFEGDAPFFSSYFMTGLLVLALSEVFRQGLMLKNDNDLTI